MAAVSDGRHPGDALLALHRRADLLHRGICAAVRVALRQHRPVQGAEVVDFSAAVRGRLALSCKCV